MAQSGRHHVIALYSNKKQAARALKTIKQIRTFGHYENDLVYFHDGSLDVYQLKKMVKWNVIIKEFPPLPIQWNVGFKRKQVVEKNKSIHIYAHKFYVFHLFFKQWEKVLYLDAGMSIYRPIQPFWELDCKDKIIAHSDAYPDFKRKFGSMNEPNDGGQFDKHADPNLFKKLMTEFDLNRDYFQSTLLLFDTKLIEYNTVNNLLNLWNLYPIVEGDQSVLNLYFNNLKNVWKPLPISDKKIVLYDWTVRPHKTCHEYIMLKYGPQPDSLKFKLTKWLDKFHIKP